MAVVSTARARRAARGLVVACTLGATPRVDAAPRDEPTAARFDVRWTAPDGCPDAAFVRPRVERFLGRPIGAPGDPDVVAEVVVAANDGLFVATITIDGAPRELSAERCDTVAEAAAYVVAAWIDPSVEPPASDEPAAPTEAIAPTEGPVAPRVEPVPAVTGPTTTRAARPRLRAAIRVGAMLGVGALPRVGPGLGGGVALMLGRVRVALDVAHLFARPARRSDRPDVGGDIRLTSAAARICPLVVLRPVEVPLCAGVELGSMHGRGVGIDAAERRRLLWAALTAGVGLIWMPSRWVGPWIDATLLVPVSRPIFDAVNVGRIHQPAAAAFTGMLGVEARFP